MKLEEFKENIEKINNKIQGRENSSEEFDNINLLNCEVTKRLVTILEKNDNIREKNILEQVIKTNLDNINKLMYKYPLDSNDIVKFKEILMNILEEIKRLKYLSIFNETNTVIVGANGSGKSSLASYFKKSDADGIIVIPAQKILFFLQNKDISFSDEENIRKIQKRILMIRIMKKTILFPIKLQNYQNFFRTILVQ